MIIARYETVGIPVPDPDYPEINCGYDDIQTGFLIVADEDMLADIYSSDPESIRRLDVVAEQPTLGL